MSSLETSKPKEMFYQGGSLPGGAEICPDSLFGDILDSYPNKYPWESHHITTEDNYILRAFRIQAKNTQITNGKPVVFLQHGTLDSADDWIINEELNSVGIRLANAGYDVWMGNSRGNKYSLNTAVKMSQKEFWDFSFQEMAWYDVPANIKYVLNLTGQKDLIYFGHSQGTTSMFASLSDEKTRDYVNSKVSKYIALAPVTYLANCPSPFYNMMAW
jgi:pimeloyl-ACP methyl ester carboxylesterase